jgi:CRISPR-associated protein Cas2
MCAVIWMLIHPFFGASGDTVMMVLITYDINTETNAGKKRLRQLAKQCQDYGQRVQNSVFECLVDAAQQRQLKHLLVELIDPDKDSLRFYYLGNNWAHRVEHVGAKPSLDLEGPLIA